MILDKYKPIEELKTGGSERQFIRCQRGGRNYILMRDNNINVYLRLYRHLKKSGIGLPRIFEIDLKKKYLIMADLGNNSLYALRDKKNIEDFYQLAIRELVKLQIGGRPGVPINNYYDYEHIKWEQEYFKKFFLHQYCKLAIVELKGLKADFENLSSNLIKEMAGLSNFLMHRDYQSKNIYIKNKRVIIIDFQSARIGPLTYDLASLLRDAYVYISKEMETTLIDNYLYLLKLRGISVKKGDFLRLYELTGLQRNMQALGAFANLSLNKKKFYFQEYIPRGIELLNNALKNTNYKKILELVNHIFLKINRKNEIENPS